MPKEIKYRFFKSSKEYDKFRYGFIWKVKCKARSKRTLKPCRRYAVPGMHVCKHHGGHAGRKVPEGKVQNLKELTKEERAQAHKIAMKLMDDLVTRCGQDPLNIDKIMVYEAARMLVKSARQLTDKHKWMEMKYKDLFLKMVKELAMTRKERIGREIAENVAKSFDMVLSDDSNVKSRTSRDKKKE